MTTSLMLGRADGNADLYNDVATAGSLTIAAQTTQSALTTVTQSGVAVVTLAAAKAVMLPQSQAVGSPIVVSNVGGAFALTVFAPWNFTTGAASGGRVYGAAITIPAANNGVAVAQGRTVLFYPHPNGIDYTAVWGAVA